MYLVNRGQQKLIHRLEREDAPEVARWLQSQTAAHVRYFHPFAFDEETVAVRLGNALGDLYLGIGESDDLVALLMLRGYDEGYVVPCLGLLVDYTYADRGWGRACVELAKDILRGEVDGIRPPRSDQLMLKVHPDNAVARHLYLTSGFIPVHYEPGTGNLIYVAELDAKGDG